MVESKFDLCADSVTLDYEALVMVSRIAMRYSLIHLGDRLHRWYDPNPLVSIVEVDGMVDDANSLAEATRAYHYLMEGRSRSRVKVTRTKVKGGG